MRCELILGYLATLGTQHPSSAGDDVDKKAVPRHTYAFMCCYTRDAHAVHAGHVFVAINFMLVYSFMYSIRAVTPESNDATSRT